MAADLTAFPPVVVVPGLNAWLGVPSGGETTNDELVVLCDRLRARVAELQGEVADAREAGHALRTVRDFNASRAAGYIDRSGLEQR